MANEYFIIKQDRKFLVGQFLSYEDEKELFHAYGIDNNGELLESSLYSLGPKDIVLKIQISFDSFLELDRLYKSDMAEFEKMLIKMTEI